MNTSISRLQKFRIDTYNLLGGAWDATFNLIDAFLTTRTANSLADFYLSPLFRREWSSTYESLQDCRPNRQKLMKRYIEEVATDKDESSYVMIGIDHTSSPRGATRGEFNSPTESAPEKILLP
ncbi:hypothetical protein [Moorena sp. SIO3I8]|uniref:hypothetical protein n=1 Tax=Moorena sp. SIO3I8 TaxID=2607833 RepID=UPI0025E98EA6|nr:hypothetical protein [Moorena sp. SIO3I8]